MPALRFCGISRWCTSEAALPCNIPEEQRPRCQDFQKHKKVQTQKWKIMGFILKGLSFATDKHTAHEIAICRNPHNSSNWDSTSLDSWFTKTPSVKMLYPRHSCFFLYVRKNITCLTAGLLRKVRSSVSCKTVYLWVTTLRRVMDDNLSCHVPAIVIMTEFYFRILFILKLFTVNNKNSSQIKVKFYEPIIILNF
jgi:hypothetical protein